MSSSICTKRKTLLVYQLAGLPQLEVGLDLRAVEDKNGALVAHDPATKKKIRKNPWNIFHFLPFHSRWLQGYLISSHLAPRPAEPRPGAEEESRKHSRLETFRKHEFQVDMPLALLPRQRLPDFPHFVCFVLVSRLGDANLVRLMPRHRPLPLLLPPPLSLACPTPTCLSKIYSCFRSFFYFPTLLPSLPCTGLVPIHLCFSFQCPPPLPLPFPLARGGGWERGVATRGETSPRSPGLFPFFSTVNLAKRFLPR